MKEDEKLSRLQILLGLSLRKEYLEINDLREAYDAVMKDIEQGRESWNPNMHNKVHQFCEFRTNLHTREKLEKSTSKE